MGKRIIILICSIVLALGILFSVASCKKTTLLAQIQQIVARIGWWDDGEWDEAKWSE